MPTEHRFDDLDLREEPSRGRTEKFIVTWGQVTCDSYHCTNSQACTDNCCSVNCP